MKKSLLFLAMLALVMVGCKDPNTDPNNDETPATPKWVTTEVTQMNVLLEEFTGQHCGYCPDGHRRAFLISQANPGRVFVASINAGGFADPQMACPDATAIDSVFSPNAYPMGQINRTTGIIDRGAWSPWANKILIRDACVNMAAKGTIDTTTRELKLTVEMYYTSDAPTEANFLTAYVLQSNIWASQSNGQKYNPDFYDETTGLYRHMHTLRCAVPAPFGDKITKTKKGSLVTKEYTYKLPEKLAAFDVVLKDLEVVVFVSETETTNVLNVCGAEITLK